MIINANNNNNSNNNNSNYNYDRDDDIFLDKARKMNAIISWGTTATTVAMIC